MGWSAVILGLTLLEKVLSFTVGAFLGIFIVIAVAIAVAWITGRRYYHD